MSRPEILQVGPLPAWDEAALAARFTVHRYFDAVDPDAFLAECGAAVRGIATRGDLGAGGKMIAALPALEVIAIYGVGFDAVDLEAAGARGIRVTNTPDVLTEDVADLAVGMMLAQARDIVGGDAWVRSGAWAQRGSRALGARVHGRRAGILGLGRIGFAVARRLAAFDMEVAYCSRSPKADAPWAFVPDPMVLAAGSDFLFVTLAANTETRHIVDARVIAALGPGGVLVNVSRGANVDEAALITALQTGALGAAALDVFADEPRIDPRFLSLPNVLLQPHVGSATVETRRAMGQLMHDNLVAHFEGRDLLTPVI